jgi:hypothetical protein
MATPSANIIISSGDALTVNAQAGTFNYRFPRPYASSGEEVISLQNLSIYYSWFNVSQAFNNTTGLSYTWVNGINYPVNLPPGFYTLAQINQYLQFTMKANGHYLLDGASKEVYYLLLAVNPIYYSITLTATPFPSALPSGWTNPASTAFFTPSLTPQLVVGATNFGLLIGFTAGTYPSVPSAIVMNYNSTITPQASPITNIFVLCSLVNDGRFSNHASVIGSFTPTVGFGELITYSPPVLTSYRIARNMYPGVVISLVDQQFRPLALNDTSQATFTLLVHQ